jgi:hypothetical protein
MSTFLLGKNFNRGKNIFIILKGVQFKLNILNFHRFLIFISFFCLVSLEKVSIFTHGI